MKRNIHTQGFSFIELMVAIMVLGILVVVAVPSFVNFLQVNRVTVAAQELFYNLNNARSEAIKRNNTIYVSFVTGSSWCYGINVGSACTCTTASSCNLGTGKASGTKVTLSLSGISGPLSFEPNHGASSANPTITFTSTGGTQAVSVKVGLLGNVQTCSNNVSGFQTCS